MFYSPLLNGTQWKKVIENEIVKKTCIHVNLNESGQNYKISNSVLKYY